MSEQNTKFTITLDLHDLMPKKTVNNRAALKTMFNVDIVPIQSESKMERLFSVSGTESNLRNFIDKFVLSSDGATGKVRMMLIEDYMIFLVVK